jgi:hypothetical protein
MAVVRRDYTLNEYWNSNDVLNMLEQALADVGFHAPTQTGSILTFTNTAGTAIVGERGKRYLVRQSATNGSGQYATFDVLRNNTTGAISAVTLVRGGKGYSGTNTLTIAGADIGGVTPTDNITITVSTVSGAQGSTTTWFDKDTASPYTWGVCCVNNDETKKMGQTYYSFQVPAIAATSLNITMSIKSGPGFQSSTNVFNGITGGVDFINSGPNATNAIFSQVIARTNRSPLRLLTFQSGIDPNFVVFQFSDVEKYGDAFRDPFIISKYNTATQPWDLDDCYTGAVYNVGRTQASNTVEAQINFSINANQFPKRCGEWGYTGYLAGGTGARTMLGGYESTFGRRLTGSTTAITSSLPTIYQRTLVDLIHEIEYNPVITGIPINNTMIPCPYYIPADFGITEVVGTNTIATRDIVKTGSTTEWRVLQYANNLNVATYNSAIAFVAKITD